MISFVFLSSVIYQVVFFKCYCERTSEESGTIGGRKEKKFVDDDLTTGKHPTI